PSAAARLASSRACSAADRAFADSTRSGYATCVIGHNGLSGPASAAAIPTPAAPTASTAAARYIRQRDPGLVPAGAAPVRPERPDGDRPRGALPGPVLDSDGRDGSALDSAGLDGDGLASGRRPGAGLASGGRTGAGLGSAGPASLVGDVVGWRGAGRGLGGAGVADADPAADAV